MAGDATTQKEVLWETMPLSEMMTLQRGFDLPSQDRKGGPVPVIASTGQVGNHDTAPVESPGVVIGRSGSIGGGQYIDVPFWPLNTTLYVRDFKGNNPKFCYYLLKSIDFSPFNSGSGVPTLNRNHLTSLQAFAPSRTDQDRIADLLGVLDAKIKLNRQIALTFEEFAQTLFRSWFVDFEPVHAKAEGRDPGLPAGLTDLFPNQFGDDGLPEGWQNKRADEIADLVRDGVEPDDLNPSTPYVGLNDMPKRQLGLADWSNASDVTSVKTRFTNGDLLFGKLRPYFHKVVVAPTDGICSSDIFVFRAKEVSQRFYMYLAFNDEEFVASASGAATGTRMPRADWSHMGSQTFAIGPKPLMKAFANFAKSVISPIAIKHAEARSLISLRDHLLPELISGELRIPDAESVVVAA